MEGFFNGLDYDECTINIEDSSFYDIEQMSNFKGEIDNEFDEKIEIYMSSSDEEFLTKEGKMKENAPINDCGKNSLCISEIQSEHKNDLTIKGILEGIKIDFSIASQIIECLIDDDLTKFEIQRKLYPCPNPEDIDEKLLIGIEMTLKRLVDNSIISIKTSYGQMYHLEDETRKLLEGDDDNVIS